MSFVLDMATFLARERETLKVTFFFFFSSSSPLVKISLFLSCFWYLKFLNYSIINLPIPWNPYHLHTPTRYPLLGLPYPFSSHHHHLFPNFSQTFSISVRYLKFFPFPKTPTTFIPPNRPTLFSPSLFSQLWSKFLPFFLIFEVHEPQYINFPHSLKPLPHLCPCHLRLTRLPYFFLTLSKNFFIYC